MMDQPPDKCPLCLHPESLRQSCNKHLAWAYDCPRCGSYYISALLYRSNHAWSERGHFDLACVAFEWHLHHPYSKFVLTDEGKFAESPYTMFPDCTIFLIEEMLALFPKPAEIIDRTLLNLSCLPKRPMDCITVQGRDMPFLSFCPDNTVRRPFYYLKNLGLIEELSCTCGEDTVTITPVGWRRIQELSKTTYESKQAFVAMWFADEMDVSYRDAIKPAIEAAGFECKRIDTVEHNNKICDEVIAAIRKSRFVVADFTAGICKNCASCGEHKTCREKVRPRGGVYFEAGFAMGLGIPVIWAVREDQIDDIHFDTRQYNYIVYYNADELRERLGNRIAATIH